MSPQNLRTGRRAALAFVAFSVFLDYAAQSISFPVLPRLSQHLLGGDLAGAARWVGFLEVAWALPQFLAAPVLGMLSDRFGRRPVIVLSVFGVAAELALNALAPSMGWLLAGRILCGFTCGGQAAAMAYVADVTPPEERTRAYGWLNAAVWTAIIAGPAFGGALAVIDIRAPFWIAAGFALMGGLYGLAVLPESLPQAGRTTSLRWSTANPWAAIDFLARRRGLLVLGVAQLLIWLAFQGKDNMLVLYTAYRYGWSALVFGGFCAALAIANIAVQGGLSGRVAGWLGDRRAFLAGMGLQVVGLAAMGWAPSGPLFWLANLPTVLGAIAVPALQSMMSAKVGPDEQGRLQGAIGSISSLTGIVAPVAVTQVFAWTVAVGRPPAWSGATILAGAGFSLVAWIVVAASRPDAPGGRPVRP